MPSIKWNKKMWTFGYKKYLEDPSSYQFYGEKWGNPEKNLLIINFFKYFDQIFLYAKKKK